MVKCIREDGFEDQLTTNAEYEVEAIGENSYLITNDNDEQRWYGMQHFKQTLA